MEKPKDRNLYFNQGVDADTIGELTQDIISINEHDAHLIKRYALLDIDYKPKPIKIYIDSYGGYLYQCFGLLSVIENSETPIHTIVTGCAMSCGFMMLIAGHKRFAHKLSTVMYHQASAGVWGKIEDMEQRTDEIKRCQQILEDVTLDKTKITKKKLTQIRKEKVDWFMDSDEALDNGVIDEII